jgi:sugar/nucleoside kinase (ribokinase family)
MAEVYVFGTPAVDILLHVPALPTAGGHIGGTLHGWRTGGSAANLACGLASAGHRVHLVGPIGDDPIADSVIADLREKGVHTGHMVRQPAPTPRTLIFIDGTGERAMVGLASPTPPPPFQPPALPGLSEADLVYVESYQRFPPALASPAAGALVAVPPPDHLAPAGPAHVVVGSTAQLPAGWASAPYRHARARFGARLRWVVLTDGPRGATAYAADRSVLVPARPARQLDATGAGDAFAAGLLHSLLAGEPIDTALACAATWGAAAVERRSSIPPAFHEVFDRP